MQLVLRMMRSALVSAGLCFSVLGTPAHASHYHRGPTSTHKAKSAGSRSRSGRHTVRASGAGRPRAIDDSRATQIQTALVKAGYLQTASGKWDAESADAMRKLQGDNGWQTKIIPDSRALIKLGLGPGSETPSSVPAGGTAPNATSPVLPAGAPVGQQ